MNAPQKAQNPLAGGLSAETKTDSAIVASEQCPDKALATLKAKMALAGFAVHEASDGYVVCRWNLSKHCPDLSALVAFSRQVGAT